MGAHLDVAADQTSLIKHDGLDAKQFDNKKNSWRLAHHEVRRQNSISGSLWFLDALDWKCGERSRKGTRANVEIAQQRSLEVFSTHVSDGKKMYSEGRDFGDMRAYTTSHRCSGPCWVSKSCSSHWSASWWLPGLAWVQHLVNHPSTMLLLHLVLSLRRSHLSAHVLDRPTGRCAQRCGTSRNSGVGVEQNFRRSPSLKFLCTTCAELAQNNIHEERN